MKPNTSPEMSHQHPIYPYWNRLIEPAVKNLEPEQYLKTRLLAALLIVLAFVDMLLSPLVIMRFYPNTTIWENPLFILYIGSLVAFLVSFVLNRNGRYLTAATIAVVFTGLIPIAGGLIFPSTTMLYLSVIYLIGVVIFGRILFSKSISSLITLVCGASILSFPLFTSAYTFTTIQLPFLGFLNIIVLLLILTKHNQNIENDRRDELLHANASLKTSETRWRSLVDNASTGVYMINDMYQFIYVNNTMAQILRYSVDELTSLDFREILTTESKELVSRYYLKRQQGIDVPSRYEFQVVHKDGQTRWVEISASVIFDARGKPTTIGQLLDINDRKQAADAIRANEEKLQALLQHSSDIVSILDEQGNLLYNSPAGQRIHGFTDEEFANANTFDLIHPDDREHVSKVFFNLLSHPDQTQIVQYRYASKVGGYTWMEAAASNQLHHPAIRGIVANSRDITERKQYEETLKQYGDKLEELVTERTAELQASESLLLRILDSISEGILVLDTELTTTFWNRAMEKISKEPSEQVVGRKLLDIFPHLTEQGVNKMIEQALAGKSVHREDIPYYLADDTTGFTTETYLPLHEENGRIRGVVGIVHDITERKQKENDLHASHERLKEMDRLKTKFIADVSHELRTPITNLNLYLDLIARGKPGKRLQYESVIREQSDRLIDLLEGILDFSNLSSHRPPQMTPLNLNEVVAKSIIKFEAKAKEKSIQFSFTPTPNLPIIAGIDEQMIIMIDNLLDNAINYTFEGSVTIETKRIENSICLTVTDTGIGLDEEELQNCFESFYRGRRIGQLNITPGAGIGLALVKEIVALHHGRVEVMSQINKGAIFTILLPIEPLTHPVSTQV